jgi:hypothetical protein
LNENISTSPEQENPDDTGVDLRGYVSCRHLQPVSIGGVEVSASGEAVEACRSWGLTYEELRNRTTKAAGKEGRELSELYLDCDRVFGPGFKSFTSALLNDYESCRAIGKVSLQNRRVLWRRFAKLFELLASELLLCKTRVAIFIYLRYNSG